MNDGMIQDRDFLAKIGFTPDKFHGYLWRDGDTVILSLVRSLQPRHGHLRVVVDEILAMGLTVFIPSPLFQMEQFIQKYSGFEETWYYSKDMGEHVPGYERKPS